MRLLSVCLILLLIGSTAVRADPIEGVGKSSELLGMDVKNPKGKAIGTVEDVVVAVESGEVIYVAITYGKTLGVGGKILAVPPGALTLHHAFVEISIPEAELDRAEGIQGESWPDAPNPQLMPKKDKRSAKDQRDKGQTLKRVSQLMDREILGREGQVLGEVDGIAFHRSGRRIVYFVLGHGGVLGIGEEFFAIAPGALTYHSENDRFTLDQPESAFKGQKGFDKRNWPTEPDPRFSPKD